VTLLQARPDTLKAVDFSEIQALHQKYLAVGNGGMCVLCRCVLDLDQRREAHADADRQFLVGVIRGTIDSVRDGFFDQTDPMFTVYADDPGMTALLAEAAAKFGDAVQIGAAELMKRLEAEGLAPPVL
jgi:hypothetical protein